MDEIDTLIERELSLAWRGIGRVVFAWLTLLTVFAAGTQPLIADPTLEDEVEAAYLFNFTKFVQWPSTAFANSDAPLRICIVGEDRFGKALDEIVQGEAVEGHRIVVERLASLNEKSCQVAYFDEAPADLSGAGGGMLTVGKGDPFLRRGGAVAFVIENRRVRFDVNLKAAANAGLKLSSRMLSVARNVEK